MDVLVTGANRGIGLEFTRQLLDRGDTVHAVARDPESAPELSRLARSHPDRLRLHRCDVSDDAQVAALAKEIEGPLDLLINNAGIGGGAEASGQTLDIDEIRRVFEVNTLGPLRVIRALLPRLLEGRTRKILNLTSRMGSIGEASGGYYPYRISKAALNMATKLLGNDLRGKGVTAIVAHPGWVQTDMGGPSAPVTPEESVRSLLKLIARVGPSEGGGFFNHTGERLPW